MTADGRTRSHGRDIRASQRRARPSRAQPCVAPMIKPPRRCFSRERCQNWHGLWPPDIGGAKTGMAKNCADHWNEKSWRGTSRYPRAQSATVVNNALRESRGGAHTSSSIRDCHICGGRSPIVNNSLPFYSITAANFVH